MQVHADFAYLLNSDFGFASNFGFRVSNFESHGLYGTGRDSFTGGNDGANPYAGFPSSLKRVETGYL
jgi:hypothetical protein